LKLLVIFFIWSQYYFIFVCIQKEVIVVCSTPLLIGHSSGKHSCLCPSFRRSSWQVRWNERSPKFLILTKDQQINDSKFVAIAEGLTSLNLLEKLQMSGLITFFFSCVTGVMVSWIGPRLSRTLKQVVLERMRKEHWPLLNEIDFNVD
jgi:hypothetical protein